MKWFEKGRLWESRDEAKDKLREGYTVGADGALVPPDGTAGRGRGWRPGGEHKDPREKYQLAKKAKWQKFKQMVRARPGHGPKPGDGADAPPEEAPIDEAPIDAGFEDPAFDEAAFKDVTSEYSGRRLVARVRGAGATGDLATPHGPRPTGADAPSPKVTRPRPSGRGAATARSPRGATSQAAATAVAPGLDGSPAPMRGGRSPNGRPGRMRAGPSPNGSRGRMRVAPSPIGPRGPMRAVRNPRGATNRVATGPVARAQAGTGRGPTGPSRRGATSRAAAIVAGPSRHGIAARSPNGRDPGPTRADPNRNGVTGPHPRDAPATMRPATRSLGAIVPSPRGATARSPPGATSRAAAIGAGPSRRGIAARSPNGRARGPKRADRSRNGATGPHRRDEPATTHPAARSPGAIGPSRRGATARNRRGATSRAAAIAAAPSQRGRPGPTSRGSKPESKGPRPEGRGPKPEWKKPGSGAGGNRPYSGPPKRNRS